MRRLSVAIIGTGIAGMAAGYLLRNKFDVTFYEKKARPGGHTNTVTVDEDGQSIYVDTGFMVYNKVTYPNLIRFFQELEIPEQPTDMSFSVQHVPMGLEYCGTGISGLFAQRRNLFNLRFLKLLSQVNRFNQESTQIIEDPKYANATIEDFVSEKEYGQDFLDFYLIPMSGAIWSTPPGKMLDFPAATLVRFFKNHGLLGLSTHFQWYTVKGGSRIYRDKVLGLFEGNVFIGNGALEIWREEDQVALMDAHGEKKIYDHVVMAAHADETLSLLKDASVLEKQLLGKFHYQKNHATLHTDPSLMPKTRRAWSSWNYRMQMNAQNELVPTTIYHMNSLQNVSQKKDYFVSINDPDQIDPKKVLWETDYTHPLFDLDAIEAQKELPKLNEDGRIFFCGSYFRYGFHEDAFMSALDVAKALAGEDVWS